MTRVCGEFQKMQECNAFLYFMGRVPCDEEFSFWSDEQFSCWFENGKCTLVKFYFILGKAFFQVQVETVAQRKVLFRGNYGYKGGPVHPITWCPSFVPKDVLRHKCPVWVYFLDLPLRT